MSDFNAAFYCTQSTTLITNHKSFADVAEIYVPILRRRRPIIVLMHATEVPDARLGLGYLHSEWRISERRN